MALNTTRGRDGEDIAVAFLVSRRYKILERNWRPGAAGMRGELDIIAWDGENLCFVEVKARSSRVGGAPQEAVTQAKQVQICRLATAYVSLKKPGEVPCRFDVVEVWLPRAGELPRVALHKSAFDYRVTLRNRLAAG